MAARSRQRAPECRRRARGRVKWVDGVTVNVQPKLVSAPDIVKIVLTRDGQQIDSVLPGLSPTTFTTRLGASVALHAGATSFPTKAFDPGAVVTLIAIPERGADNFAKTFTDKELRSIQ